MRQGIRAGNCDRPRAIFHQPRRRNATTASTVSRENRLQIASITRGEYTARFIHRLFTELCSGFCRHAAECTVTEITPAKVLRILTLLVIADGGVSTLAMPSACCTPHGGTKMVSTSRPSGRNSDISDISTTQIYLRSADRKSDKHRARINEADKFSLLPAGGLFVRRSAS